MRKLLSFIFTFSIIFGVNAQESPLPNSKSFEVKEFKLDSAYLTIPRLQFNKNKGNSLKQNKDGLHEYLRDPSGNIEKNPLVLATEKIHTMPTYNPILIAQMPIQVPDSSVKYHIKIKDFSKENFENRLLE